MQAMNLEHLAVCCPALAEYPNFIVLATKLMTVHHRHAAIIIYVSGVLVHILAIHANTAQGCR